MSMHEPNQRDSSEIDEALRKAKFRPDAAFEERLHTRLIEKLPSAKPRSWWQMLWDFIVRDDKESKAVRGSRLIGVFGLGILALMVVLFVALVLVRPSGTAIMETPDATETPVRQAVGTIFGGELELVETSVEPAGGVWILRMYWKVLKQPTKDYQLAVFATFPDGRASEIEGAWLAGYEVLPAALDDRYLHTSEWQVDHMIATSEGLSQPSDMPAPESVSIEVRDPESGWTLTLEYQGYSLSTVRAGVWSASKDAVSATETLDPPTPHAPIAIGSLPTRVALSGDGSTLAVEMRRAGEWPQLYMVNGETGKATSVAGGAWPNLTVDGSQIVFVIQPRGEVDPNWNGANLINTYSEGNYFDISSSSGMQVTMATTPVISADGNIVVFAAQDVENRLSQVYAYDRRTGEVERSATFFDDEAPTNLYQAHPDMSADGRYVVFYVAAGATTQAGVVLWDREQDTAAYVTPGFMPEISADGHTIAYLEDVGETQQAVGWINARAYNVQTGESRWLGRVLDSVPDGQWQDRVLSLSADGSRIAFWSVLENPRDEGIGAPEVSGGLGSVYENRYIFVYEWDADGVQRGDPIDAPHPPGVSGSPSLSADGMFLAYVWRNVVGDMGGVYLRDLIGLSTEAISVIE